MIVDRIQAQSSGVRQPDQTQFIGETRHSSAAHQVTLQQSHTGKTIKQVQRVLGSLEYYTLI